MKDLSCSICELPRQRVKLIVGKRANLCGKCIEDCVTPKKPTSFCPICDQILGDNSEIDANNPSMCKKCVDGCKQVLRRISPGQAWLVYKESAFCCKPHRSEEANKVFYEQSLHDFSQKGININSGEILVDMFEIKPSKRLLVYSRKFLFEFPNHQQGPRVLSFWLKLYPSKESYDLAAKYLKRHWPVEDLHWLFNSVKAGKQNKRLDTLMEERLEKSYKDDIWCRCLSPYESRAKFANRLSLRWLELNEENPDLLLQGFTYFAESREVIEAIWKHLKKHGISRTYNEWEIHDILDKARQMNLKILPEIVEFARKWLSENRNDIDYAPEIISSILRISGADKDLNDAKDWYRKHRKSGSAYRILYALLHAKKDGKPSPDSFAIEEARVLLRDMPPGQRTPSLVGALLNAVQDDEIIGWTKEVYESTGMLWVLIELLRHAPNADIIAEAKLKLRKYLHTEMGHELLHELLERDPDVSVRRCARSWLDKNPTHQCAKKVRKQLEG